MTEELNAFKVLSEENINTELLLTPSELKRKYGKKNHEIFYFLEDDEPRGRNAKQQAVLKLAKDTGGLVFTGIHSETDWDRTRWWDLGWRLANRTGEYVVVVPKGRLPSVVTGPASLKRYGKALHETRGKRRKTGATPMGVRGLR